MIKNKWMAGLSLMLASVPLLATAITSPTVIPLPDGGQANVAVSNSETNLFTVPGDRITALNSPNDALVNLKNTDNGGVVFTTLSKKPFTFVLETERGHNFSIRAVPGEHPGRTIQIVNDQAGANSPAKAWELATPYETLLVEVNRGAMTGRLPAGYSPVPVTTETLKTPSGLRADAEQAWQGHQLKVVRFSVVNTGVSDVPVTERDFWQPGTRSIMFAQPASTLLAGGRMQLYVTWSDGGAYAEH